MNDKLNFLKREPKVKSVQKIDESRLLEGLAERIEELAPQQQYAPPAVRGLDEPIRQIKTFGELPTREIDDLFTAADQELAQLKQDAQDVRNVYDKHTARIMSDAQKLISTVKLARDMLQKLGEQCQQTIDEKSDD